MNTDIKEVQAAAELNLKEAKRLLKENRMWLLIGALVLLLLLGLVITFCAGFGSSGPQPAHAKIKVPAAAVTVDPETHWQDGRTSAANAIALCRLGLVDWDEAMFYQAEIDQAPDFGLAFAALLKIAALPEGSLEQGMSLADLPGNPQPEEYLASIQYELDQAAGVGSETEALGMTEFCRALAAVAELCGVKTKNMNYAAWDGAEFTYENVADAMYYTLCLPLDKSSVGGLLVEAEIIPESEAVLADLPCALNTEAEFRRYFVASLENDSRRFVYTEKNCRLMLELMLERDSIFALINQENTLSSDYLPELVDTTELPTTKNASLVRLRAEAYAALKDLFAAAAQDGINLYTRSGYRSYETQRQLYGVGNNSYRAEAGTSEHQSGLAMDLVNWQNSLSSALADCVESKWLSENAQVYGFVIRYIPEKEQITGYPAEWWHVRYLGKTLACELKACDWAYEEFFDYCQQIVAE